MNNESLRTNILFTKSEAQIAEDGRMKETIALITSEGKERATRVETNVLIRRKILCIFGNISTNVTVGRISNDFSSEKRSAYSNEIKLLSAERIQ